MNISDYSQIRKLARRSIMEMAVKVLDESAKTYGKPKAGKSVHTTRKQTVNKLNRRDAKKSTSDERADQRDADARRGHDISYNPDDTDTWPVDEGKLATLIRQHSDQIARIKNKPDTTEYYGDEEYRGDGENPETIGKPIDEEESFADWHKRLSNYQGSPEQIAADRKKYADRQAADFRRIADRTDRRIRDRVARGGSDDSDFAHDNGLDRRPEPTDASLRRRAATDPHRVGESQESEYNAERLAAMNAQDTKNAAIDAAHTAERRRIMRKQAAEKNRNRAGFQGERPAGAPKGRLQEFDPLDDKHIDWAAYSKNLNPNTRQNGPSAPARPVTDFHAGERDDGQGGRRPETDAERQKNRNRAGFQGERPAGAPKGRLPEINESVVARFKTLAGLEK